MTQPDRSKTETNTDIKKTKNKKQLGLSFIWGICLRLWAEGDKLWAEGDKLRAEGYKLLAEGNKLQAEGDKLWAEAILAVHGNIKIEWKNYTEKGFECHLETGEVFKP